MIRPVGPLLAALLATVAAATATPTPAPTSVPDPAAASAPDPDPDPTPDPGPAPAPDPAPDPDPDPDSSPSPSPSPAPSPLPAPEPPAPPHPHKSAAKAGWLAALFPGLGHLYLGEGRRGAVFLGAETLELGAAIATVTTSGYDPEDPSDTRANRALLPLAWLQNTHLLGVYDAWRIARERAPPGRYRTPTPTPDTPGMLLAPFAGRQLLRPAVIVPLALVWGAGIGCGLYCEGNEPTFRELERIPIFSRELDRNAALAAAGGYYTATFYAVGIGEEALFRGVIQTALEESWGPTWGWVGATAIFGSLHALNGATAGEAAIAVGVTSVLGGYLGWLYQHDGHDLTAPVFVHTWYDVGIGLTVFLLDPEHQPFTASFSIPF